MNTLLFLGNDIVDYADSPNKNSDHRFRGRVFTSEENKAINQAQDPNYCLWALWAAKEAAFKAQQKYDLTTVFAPIQFVVCPTTLPLLCEHNGEVEGELTHGKQRFRMKWRRLSAEVVHCLALLGDNERSLKDIAVAVRRCQDRALQSDMVRQLALSLLPSTFQKRYRIQRRPLRLGDQLRLLPPYFYEGNDCVHDIELSLSHDGSYVAAAVVMTF